MSVVFSHETLPGTDHFVKDAGMMWATAGRHNGQKAYALFLLRRFGVMLFSSVSIAMLNVPINSALRGVGSTISLMALRTSTARFFVTLMSQRRYYLGPLADLEVANSERSLFNGPSAEALLGILFVRRSQLLSPPRVCRSHGAEWIESMAPGGRIDLHFQE